MDYSHLTAAKLKSEYRQAFESHQEILDDYDNNTVEVEAVDRSAQRLKTLALAYHIEMQSRQIRKT
jgi:hypothetical protein